MGDFVPLELLPDLIITAASVVDTGDGDGLSLGAGDDGSGVLSDGVGLTGRCVGRAVEVGGLLSGIVPVGLCGRSKSVGSRVMLGLPGVGLVGRGVPSKSVGSGVLLGLLG